MVKLQSILDLQFGFSNITMGESDRFWTRHIHDRNAFELHPNDHYQMKLPSFIKLLYYK